MQVLETISDLSAYIDNHHNDVGCLADTGFLYALAYKDDRLFDLANDVHDLLVEMQVPLFANVISRMELIDLIFRKQVTLGCLQIFEKATSHPFDTELYKTLKDIRDRNTAAIRKKESFKIDERSLKKLRKSLADEYGIHDWSDFCSKFVGSMLTNEWIVVEQDLGLNFIEIMEGHTSDLFNSPLLWRDLVGVIGSKGLRGPDAMIVNLFAKSKLQLLVTSDSDFKECFNDPLEAQQDKAIFLLQ